MRSLIKLKESAGDFLHLGTGVGIIACLFALLLAAGCNGSASGEPDFGTTVDRLIAAAQTTNKVPSLCVAIGRKGTVLYSQCAGLIDIAKNIPATPASIYMIGSITKQFTTTAIIMLANQNPPALSTDDPVSKYIPALSTDRGVTIASLMNMSAGLVDYTTLPQAPSWFTGVAPSTVIDALAPLPPHFQSGTAFEYSNSNTFVLGAVIEKVTGQLTAISSRPDSLNQTAWPRLIMDRRLPGPTRWDIRATTRPILFPPWSSIRAPCTPRGRSVPTCST
jgi:D-alanyl-D-alanine carboxypeptidase